MSEKFSSFERVIGTPDEDEKEQILDERKSAFDANKARELKEHEVQKTPEEIAVISLANEATNTIRRKFRLPDFNIPPENIAIIQREYWDWKKDGNSSFYPSEQLIATSYRGPTLTFARLMFHEMIHFKSFGSLKIMKGGRETTEDRVGLHTRIRGGKEYFRSLNEATIEELADRFIADLISQRGLLFREEIENLEQGVETEEDLEEYYDELRLVQPNFAYEEQRDILDRLIDKLYSQNKENFKSRDEIFDVFVKSMFSNNLLEVGKLIDRSFGKGTFRKIGKLETNPDKQYRFISDL